MRDNSGLSEQHYLLEKYSIAKSFIVLRDSSIILSGNNCLVEPNIGVQRFMVLRGSRDFIPGFLFLKTTFLRVGVHGSEVRFKKTLNANYCLSDLNLLQHIPIARRDCIIILKVLSAGTKFPRWGIHGAERQRAIIARWACGQTSAPFHGRTFALYTNSCSPNVDNKYIVQFMLYENISTMRSTGRNVSRDTY